VINTDNHCPNVTAALIEKYELVIKTNIQIRVNNQYFTKADR